MAPKRPLQAADHPSTPSPSDSSSDSSSFSSSSSEAEQEEKAEEEQAHPTKSPSPSPAHVVDKKASFETLVPTSTIKPVAPSSSSSSSSSSQADSESPPQRPVSSPSPKSNKARVSAPSPAKPSTSKRPLEILIELPRKELKRTKKSPQHEEESGKWSGKESRKQLFQRIWSEDDEIVVLKGMAYYSAKRGCVPYPNGNVDEFHDFLRDSLQGQFSRAQFIAKICRLKKKFENNLYRAKLGGDPTFNNPHEQKSFQLSRKIWGSERRNRERVQRSRKSSGKARAKLKAVKVVEEEEQEAEEEEDAHGDEVEEREAEEDKEEEEVLPIYSDVKEKNAVKIVEVPNPKPKPQPSKKHSLVEDFVRAHICEYVGLSSGFSGAVKIGFGLLSETVKENLKEEWEDLIEEEVHVYGKKLELIQIEARKAMQAFFSFFGYNHASF